MITAGLSGVVDANVPGYIARDRSAAIAQVPFASRGGHASSSPSSSPRPGADVPLDEAALLIAAHAHPDLDVAVELGRLDDAGRRPAPRRRSTASCAHLFVDLGFRRQLGQLLRPPQLVPRPGRDPPTRHPDHAVGAGHRRRAAPRRAARRGGHARALPAARPGRPRSVFVDPFVGGDALDRDGLRSRSSARCTARRAVRRPLPRPGRHLADPRGPHAGQPPQRLHLPAATGRRCSGCSGCARCCPARRPRTAPTSPAAWLPPAGSARPRRSTTTPPSASAAASARSSAATPLASAPASTDRTQLVWLRSGR